VPALSVIIPCYNVQDYVSTMVESLRRNTARDIEFLLVEDGSTDATADILRSQGSTLPGARLITHAENRGLSAARNLGIDNAAGEYLTFLDGDDFVAPGYFADLLATIRAFRCSMIRTDHVQVRGRRRTVHRIGHGPRGVVMPARDAILPVHRPTSVDVPNAWAGIYHRRLADVGLLRFDETLRTCEDRPWIWRLHLRVDDFAVVGLLGVFYRRDISSSLTSLIDERQFDFLRAHDLIIADVMADAEAERLLPKAVRSYCAMICHHLARSARYPRPLASRLRERSAGALRRLPAGVVADVIPRMDDKRRRILHELRAVA
jgi:glycosyltransferase involved in cell wall biosynthesis